MSNNCLKGMELPFRSYAGLEITDYRSSNDRENELRNILKVNGCSPKNSYDARICMQNNSDVVKMFLNKNFNNSLGSNVCKNN